MSTSAQQGANQQVEGIVYELVKGVKQPLIGANIYWSNSTSGTITRSDGSFSIDKSLKTNKLVISFIAYQSDTILVSGSTPVEHVLSNNVQIDDVEVVRRRKTTELSLLEPIQVQKIGEAELSKAACCNLSESFETNPSVDVSFTDAITGTKQIQMLGLAGPYTQITRESMPDIRGLSALYGMEYIPGTWIESIQLSKGTGSVANGFESIAGQINVELRKPEEADRLYLNLFGNAEGRVEANLNLAHKVNEKWSSGLLLHGRNQSLRFDHNNDGFMDKPVGSNFVAINRWKYIGTNGIRFQAGVKAVSTESVGGQLNYQPEQLISDSIWGMEMNTRRAEAWMKLGKLFPDKPYKSVGFQLSGTWHETESLFGIKQYNARQKSLYSNLLYQSIIGSSIHSYRTGVSFQLDNFDEELNGAIFNRMELVPGAYFEYTFIPNQKFSLVSGIRGDYHNNYGFFVTPRIHARYNPFERTAFRISAGRGLKTASILAENASVLASSRQVHILGDSNSENPYGLKPEIAWNFGANVTQKFTLDYRQGALSAEVYHTRFTNQVVVDLEEAHSVLFYNLEGESYSTSFQFQADYEVIRRLDVRLAYRRYDVKIDYASGTKTKPLVSPNRAFVNLAYATRNRWKFDYTVQWQDSKRIPSTLNNPVQYRIKDESPGFVLMNAQVSKSWKHKWEAYVGVENMTNYKQENPIIASDSPFSDYFDSSLIWGPVAGRMFYVGMRYKLK